jgi:hypothetical protein
MTNKIHRIFFAHKPHFLLICLMFGALAAYCKPNYADELQERQQILLGILCLAEEQGVQFAVPTQSLHIKSLPNIPDQNVPLQPEQALHEKN